MILLFYGEDNYRLKQKIKELKAKFTSASLGNTNLAVLDGKTILIDELTRQVLAFPFLAKSRLVLVENLLKEGKKEIQDKVIELLPKVPVSTVLAFMEDGSPDKRTSLFKKLNQPKQVQEFKLLEPLELSKWIKQEIEKRGANIDTAAIQLLINYVGNDLWRLSNELDKLIAYRLQTTVYGTEKDQKGGSRLSVDGSLINVNDVNLLVRSQTQSNIFDLIDAVANKNQKRATQELHRLIENGEAALYIFTMIIYQYRNLLIVKDLEERSNRPLYGYDIAKYAGLHPFVAQKTLIQTKKYTFSELKNIYKFLLDFDLRIKTGKIEPNTAIDLLVVKLSVNSQSSMSNIQSNNNFTN